MIPRSFEYHSPRTLDEAIALLQKLGPEAKLLSGGQSLIPMMKLRLVSPEHIVDINSDEIFDWPWLYVVSGGDWLVNESEAARLRQYLDRGGFLVTDDLHGPGQRLEAAAVG